MSILALDIGEKRTGVAISESRIISKPLSTISHKNSKDLLNSLKNIIEENQVIKIIIGLPISFSRSENQQQISIKKIGKKIKQRFNIKVEYFDETLTTKISNLKFKDSKANYEIDSESASEILQSYLEKINK